MSLSSLPVPPRRPVVADPSQAESEGPKSSARPPASARAAARQAALKRKRRQKIHERRQASVEPGAAKSEINVTPLVDVVLVLLIIFMVVTPMLHRGVDLEVPQTKNHSKRQDTGEQIVVSVRGDGTYVEADRVEVDKLSSVLEKELKSGSRPVNVRAERSLKFGAVRKALEQVHAAGAAVVNMETQERKE